jgi:hypothetical protein
MRSYSRFLPSKEAAEHVHNGHEQNNSKVASPVVLHIYDVSKRDVVKKMNSVLTSIGTGAFHAGVEVHGREYSFGATDHGSGIVACQPGQNTAHAYLKAMPMGETILSPIEVRDLIVRLAEVWQGAEYDLLRCNCCHFSSELCKQLGARPLPGWILNLAGAGEAIDDKVQSARDKMTKFKSPRSSRRERSSTKENKFGMSKTLTRIASNLSSTVERVRGNPCGYRQTLSL